MQTAGADCATAFPVPWAVKLIERLHALYGSKFLQQWDGVEKPKLAVSWAEALRGFSGEEVARGLAACRSRPWPPTIPEFIGLCRPWLDPEAAFREAVVGMSKRKGGSVGAWSHPAIYWAAVRIGAHDLLSTGWQAIRGRWESALRDALAEGQWQPIPAPTTALPVPGAASLSAEEKKRFLRQLKQAGSSFSLDDDGRIKCPKAWAHRILENPEGRPVAVLSMARNAVKGVEVQA